MREYTILRREVKGMSRNDIDAVENMPDEDPPTPTEAAPALQIQEVEQKHCVGDYVTVLPDTTARSDCFWGYQGYVARVDTSDGDIVYEIKNSVMHGSNGLMVPQGRIVMSAKTPFLNAEKMRKRDYNIMCRERREMSQNDVDAVENTPDEDPSTPTETILDPWEMAFCPSIRAKVCFHTTIFRLDHNTFYILLFFISEVILYVHLNPLHLPRCLLILRLHRDINSGARVQDGSSIRHINISFFPIKSRWNIIHYSLILKKVYNSNVMYLMVYVDEMYVYFNVKI